MGKAKVRENRLLSKLASRLSQYRYEYDAPRIFSNLVRHLL